jgi:hypothetical protein
MSQKQHFASVRDSFPDWRSLTGHWSYWSLVAKTKNQG